MSELGAATIVVLSLSGLALICMLLYVGAIETYTRLEEWRLSALERRKFVERDIERLR